MLTKRREIFAVSHLSEPSIRPFAVREALDWGTPEFNGRYLRFACKKKGIEPGTQSIDLWDEATLKHFLQVCVKNKILSPEQAQQHQQNPVAFFSANEPATLLAKLNRKMRYNPLIRTAQEVKANAPQRIHPAFCAPDEKDRFDPRLMIAQSKGDYRSVAGSSTRERTTQFMAHSKRYNAVKLLVMNQARKKTPTELTIDAAKEGFALDFYNRAGISAPTASCNLIHDAKQNVYSLELQTEWMHGTEPLARHLTQVGRYDAILIDPNTPPHQDLQSRHFPGMELFAVLQVVTGNRDAVGKGADNAYIHTAPPPSLVEIDPGTFLSEDNLIVFPDLSVQQPKRGLLDVQYTNRLSDLSLADYVIALQHLLKIAQSNDQLDQMTQAYQAAFRDPANKLSAECKQAVQTEIANWNKALKRNLHALQTTFGEYVTYNPIQLDQLQALNAVTSGCTFKTQDKSGRTVLLNYPKLTVSQEEKIYWKLSTPPSDDKNHYFEIDYDKTHPNALKKIQRGMRVNVHGLEELVGQPLTQSWSDEGNIQVHIPNGLMSKVSCQALREHSLGRQQSLTVATRPTSATTPPPSSSTRQILKRVPIQAKADRTSLFEDNLTPTAPPPEEKIKSRAMTEMKPEDGPEITSIKPTTFRH